MRINEGIRVEERETCPLCAGQGRILYRELRDALYSAPGIWNFSRCSDCDIAWLNPQPLPEDAGKAYQTFFTHEVDPTRPRMQRIRSGLKHGILATALGYKDLRVASGWRWAGRIVSLFPSLREMAGVSVCYLHHAQRGVLVDVGAGNGEYLATMASLGWSVRGVEPDAQAVAVIRQRYNFPVFEGTLGQAGLPSESADVLVMNHVIEHVGNPIQLPRECRRVLRPRGLIAIVTPNVRSLAHHFLKDSWRGLEPSRHFVLFSPDALRQAVEAAGFDIRSLHTSPCTARQMYAASCQIRRTGKVSFRPPLSVSSICFLVLEWGLNFVLRGVGEEIALAAIKN